MSSRMVAAIALLVFGASAHAQEEAAAENSPWSGKAALGYLATSGNTENTSLNTNFEVSYSSGNWIHTLKAFAINASESDETTAEGYGAGWKSERNLSEVNFLFGELDWRKDRFSGVPEQFSQTVGYGRRIFKTPAHLLNAEIGAGARQSEDSLGNTDSEFVVRGAGHYKWTFTETANFTFDLLVEYGDSNTYTQSDFALRARLIGNLNMVASYTIKNNSEVPAGTEDTDTFTALSLEYAF
ncbi:MAG: DUF481 domain-containing protein [Gammaproteobacteria bacterium]|nr:DUF481 domain-containing protein [Gammaproteobacteria bacterium]